MPSEILENIFLHYVISFANFRLLFRPYSQFLQVNILGNINLDWQREHIVDACLVMVFVLFCPEHAGGNRKRAVLVLGPYCLRDFYATHPLWRKILSIVNVVV